MRSIGVEPEASSRQLTLDQPSGRFVDIVVALFQHSRYILVIRASCVPNGVENDFLGGQ